MNFEELNDYIPYAMYGKEKSLRMSPYPGVTLAMPGRHAKDTTPKGGDFVVMIDTPALDMHQFKHDDIFVDIDKKREAHGAQVNILMTDYYQVITGSNPPIYADDKFVGIHPTIFLRAIQCLAVAEHRRYAKFEPKGGGRYLPFRFAAGIAAGEWTVVEAVSLQKKGRPGVEMLENQYGTPVLTKELFKFLKED